MQKQNDDYMNIALAEARLAAQAGEVPIGAIIVMGGEVIGRGGNSTRRQGVVTAHAELCALAQAEQLMGDYRLDGGEIYVTVEPCLMCLGAIYQARITKLVYGCAEPKFGALESRFELADHPVIRKMQITRGVMADEAALQLREFFQGLRT